jgi:tetratricopeptide (TPR) repeat protein
MSVEVSDLVVFCRPEQWREAATVLSCCPPNYFTPLIVVEQPPVDDDRYRVLYEAYAEVRDRRDAMSGTDMAREAVAIPEWQALNAATDAAAEALAPFLSWWRHQRSVADLLKTRPPRRAILLFDPAPGEFDLIDAIPVSRIGPERYSVLPPGTERMTLTADCEVLTVDAWRACGRSGDMPAPEGPADDLPLGWFAALWRALRTEGPIARGAQPLADPDFGDGTEAVLVEVDADATGLIGVQYAHARHARLVLTPAPDAHAIEVAIAAMSGASGAKLFGGVRTFWQSLIESPDIARPLEAIETAVNAAVPDEVVRAVGERDLTAFTRVVPYSFVRKRGADWSAKTIGHIAGDPTLIVLVELIGGHAADEIGFTLLFDIGAFDTTETTDVMRLLRDRPAVPLLLSHAAAAQTNLRLLAEALPLEFIHFNTHGMQQEIVLADGELPAWRLFREPLPTRPFVFNNSCLSWVGVGREFMRLGARGYIGTLWPVDAEQAARLAKTVLERVIRQRWPVAKAIRATGVDRHTDRAYIFAGTASARLAEGLGGGSRRDMLARKVRQLLQALTRSLEQGYKNPVDRWFVTPMRNQLWTTANSLLAVLDQTWPVPDGNRVGIANFRLSVIARQAVESRWPDPARQAEIAAAEDVLARSALPDGEKVRQRSQLHYGAGCIALAEGRTADAITLLTQSAAGSGADAAAALTLLSDALRQANRTREALETAERALVLTEFDPRNSRQRLLTLGRVGQLARIERDEERALEVARQGFLLATELDDPRERATFKGDETRSLMSLKRPDEAVAAARVYRNLARQAFSELEDLAAAGALVQALTMAGQTEEADAIAQGAMKRAITIGQRPRAAQFLLDRANIAVAEGRLAHSVSLRLEAATVFAECGEMDRCRNALGLMTECINALCRKNDPDCEALMREGVRTQVALLPRVTPDLQSAIVTQSTSFVSRLTGKGDGRTIAAELTKLLNLSLLRNFDF